ncbi:angiopoietin-like protein 8 [Pempheris klunzingeri]|uniref:angiopoietin-like protein 8 n=1 Tax=Pempheris klunzingeri TaxID=3127111 RepID=UPI00397EB9D8
MGDMKMIWGVCLLCLAGGLRGLHAGPLRKTSKIEKKTATQEEVNVLMFGVIQFSESINYVYETTEAKIAKVSETLKSHEATLQKLGKQTERAADTEEQIKEVIQLLQAQMAKQQAQAKMTKDWLTSVEQEEVELKTKVKRLEMYLNNSAPTSIKELQERAEGHSNVLKDLQHLTEFQKENIESQNEQLSRLQKMMSEAMR